MLREGASADVAAARRPPTPPNPSLPPQKKTKKQAKEHAAAGRPQMALSSLRSAIALQREQLALHRRVVELERSHAVRFAPPEGAGPSGAGGSGDCGDGGGSDGEDDGTLSDTPSGGEHDYAWIPSDDELLG